MVGCKMEDYVTVGRGLHYYSQDFSPMEKVQAREDEKN